MVDTHFVTNLQNKMASPAVLLFIHLTTTLQSSENMIRQSSFLLNVPRWIPLFIGLLVSCTAYANANDWGIYAEQLPNKMTGTSPTMDGMLEDRNPAHSMFSERTGTKNGKFILNTLVIVGPDAADSETPMTEGDSQTFTVALSAVPTGDVTVSLAPNAGLSLSQTSLTFTVTNYNVHQAVTVTAADNMRIDGNRQLNVDISAAGGGYDAQETLVLYVNDNDRGEIILNPTVLYNVKEGSSETFTVNLSLEPSGNVTVTLTPKEGLSLNQTSLTFTPTNYNTPQSVTLTVIENNMPDDPRWLRIDIVSSGGGYLDKTFFDTQAIDASGNIGVGAFLIDGLDAADSETPLTEGDSQTFTVALLRMPSDNVIVSLTSETGLSLDQASLTFTVTNYNVPQEVTVTATDDMEINSNRNLNIAISSTGGGYDAEVTLPLYVNDNDRGAIILNPKSFDNVKESTSETFTVRLNLAPKEDVTVTLTPGEGLSLSQTSLTFTPTNYNTPQSVTLTAIENNLPDNPRTIRIDLTPSGGGFLNVAFLDVQVIDFVENLEGEEILVDGPNARSADMPIIEGDSQTFTVALSVMPNDDVTVSLTSEASLSTDQTSLTFMVTNYNVPQQVTVTATENSVANGNSVARMVLSSEGGGYDVTEHIFLYLEDDDIAGVEVTPTSIRPLEEGKSATFTTRLKVEPVDNVTVSIEFLDQTNIKLDASPTSLIFTPMNFSVPQEVTITAVDNTTEDSDGWERILLTTSGEEYERRQAVVDVYLVDNDMPVAIESESLPEKFSVVGNYPNPFQNSTHLTFDLPWSARVQVEVMDVIGRTWLTVPESSIEAGWERAVELHGSSLPAGLYLYRLIADSSQGVSVRTGRFMVVR